MRHVAPDSATKRALQPELADFASSVRQSAILADIYDAIERLNFTIRSKFRNEGEIPPRMPKPYPRPGQKEETLNIGSDPIPIADFNEWYYGGD